MSTLVNREPWVDDRSSEVLEGAWIATAATPTARPGRTGRVLQPEEQGTLASAVLAVIGGARDVVLVSSFLLAEPATEQALLDAAKNQGVRVYILVASEARLEREAREDDEFGQRVFKEHCELLDRLVGWVCLRSAEHFHAKAVLADPTTAPRGLLLTSNLTEDALRRNHELAVELHPDEVRDLAALFMWAFWEAPQHELRGPGRLPPVSAAGRVALPPEAGAIVCTAGTRRDLRAAVLELIEGATRRLVVTTFGIADREVVEALCRKAQANVPVTLLVRHPRGALLPVLRELSRSGVHVVGAGRFLHAKAIVADGTRGLVMTANFETHGLDDGFELGVRLAGNDAVQLERVLAAWNTDAEFRLRDRAALSEIHGPVQILNGKGYKDLVVEPLHQANAGIVDVDCCTKVDAAKRPAPPRLPEGRLFHRVEYAWAVRAPVLAHGAKPVPPPTPKPEDGKNESDVPASEAAPPFPVYREPGGRRVFVVPMLADVATAKAAMKAFRIDAIVLPASPSDARQA